VGAAPARGRSHTPPPPSDDDGADEAEEDAEDKSPDHKRVKAARSPIQPAPTSGMRPTGAARPRRRGCRRSADANAADAEPGARFRTGATRRWPRGWRTGGGGSTGAGVGVGCSHLGCGDAGGLFGQLHRP
jgi:hypothetical protein